MSGSWPWYDVVEGGDLEQGDLLRDCPVPRLPEQATLADLQGADEGGAGPDITVECANVVVLSQSCDLALKKVWRVLVCRYHSLAELATQEQVFQEPKRLEEIRRGYLPAYHMLNCCDLLGHAHGIQVVDFRDPVGLPLDFVRQWAANSGPRLRLLPPYREHLAQAFARFFMRVGLPADIASFLR